MPSYTEPIIVQIVNDVNAKITSSGGGNAVKGAAGLSATFNVLQDIYGLVKEAVAGVLRPVVNVVKGVLKLLAQFLRPAIDLIMILLMPILQMLKPMVKIFNEIMRPFRQIAYDMIKKGGATAMFPAMAVINLGFITALINVLGEMIKQSTTLILSLLKPLLFYPLADLLPWFDREMVDKAFSHVQDTISGTIDTGLGFLNDQALNAAKGIRSLIKNVVGEVATAARMSINDAVNTIKSRSNSKGEIITTQDGGKTSIQLNKESNYGMLEIRLAAKKKYAIDVNSKESAADVFNRLRNG